MKLMHSTTTVLTTREFNKLSEKIIESLYELTPEIQELYDIHINYINDAWQIDFLPMNDNLPVIDVDTYVDQDNRGNEILKIVPAMLSDLPGKIKFSDENSSSELCINYVALFDFLISLYDFTYKVN